MNTSLITGALVIASFSLGSLCAAAVARPETFATMVGKAAVVNTLSGPQSAVLVALPSGASSQFNLLGDYRTAFRHGASSSFVCERDGDK